MSYDITIAADDKFSRSIPVKSLQKFISSLADIQPNGDRGFVLSKGKSLWMEIDLESVSEEGDILDDCETCPTVNCVRLHIPYSFLGDPPNKNYFAIARAIAKHSGWPAIDEQTGESL